MHEDGKNGDEELYGTPIGAFVGLGEDATSQGLLTTAYTNYDKHLSIIGHEAAINAGFHVASPMSLVPCPNSKSPKSQPTIEQMKVETNLSEGFFAKCMVSCHLFCFSGRKTKSLRRLSSGLLAKKIYKNSRKY